MRWIAMMCILAGCNVNMADATDTARKTAKDTLAVCRNVCPSATTAMAVAAYDSDLAQIHWTCGCLDAPPEKRQ